MAEHIVNNSHAAQIDSEQHGVRALIFLLKHITKTLQNPIYLLERACTRSYHLFPKKATSTIYLV